MRNLPNQPTPDQLADRRDTIEREYFALNYAHRCNLRRFDTLAKLVDDFNEKLTDGPEISLEILVDEDFARGDFF